MFLLNHRRVPFRTHLRGRSVRCWSSSQTSPAGDSAYWKRIGIAIFIGIPAFRAAWQLAPIGAIFQRQNHYEASMYLRITQVLILSLLKQLSRAPPLLVFSPTSVYAKNNYREHRPCWCFHQQAFIRKQYPNRIGWFVMTQTTKKNNNRQHCPILWRSTLLMNEATAWVIEAAAPPRVEEK